MPVLPGLLVPPGETVQPGGLLLSLSHLMHLLPMTTTKIKSYCKHLVEDLEQGVRMVLMVVVVPVEALVALVLMLLPQLLVMAVRLTGVAMQGNH